MNYRFSPLEFVLATPLRKVGSDPEMVVEFATLLRALTFSLESDLLMPTARAKNLILRSQRKEKHTWTFTKKEKSLSQSLTLRFNQVQLGQGWFKPAR